MLSELIFSSRNFASVSIGERSFNPNHNSSQLCQSISLAVRHNLTPHQLAQRLVEKFVAAHGDRTQRNILVQEEDIKIILGTVREVFMSQPMLMEVNGPLKILGDTHGQFYDLLRIFEKCGFPSAQNAYLFLGDYVDRGKHSIETIILLFCYKILYPTAFTLLRGNHECASINRQYGFFDDVKRRYNVKLFRVFTAVFDTMPICGVVSGKIICMHGGLSPDLGNVQLINQIARPCDVPHEGIMCDLLWSDPSDDDNVSGFLPSSRGVGWEFGADMVEAFLDHVDMDLIVRAHQVQERGYGFFANRQLVSIFSAPGYCGEFNNDAAVMNVDAKLQCSFTVIPPRQLFW